MKDLGEQSVDGRILFKIYFREAEHDSKNWVQTDQD
jgi:hypothetical protein